MPLSRSSKVTLLLAIDVVFFVVEITIGYVVGSLALVADSFHMLNDVMSLVVALYAIKLAKSEASPKYSYGFLRAEIVAALINGVFLLALCFSIVMEAIQRFFNKQEVSNPKLVIIVGSLGLLSNLFGLFLFHEHAHHHHHPAKVQPKVSNGEAAAPPAEQPAPAAPPQGYVIGMENIPPTSEEADSLSQLYGYPAATRASVMQVAEDMYHGRAVSPISHREGARSRTSISEPRRSMDARSGRGVSSDLARSDVRPATPMEPETTEPTQQATPAEVVTDEATPRETDESQQPTHRPHGHAGGGHSHGSMNMRGLVLHVIGDALGNVGVIVTGLIIWLSTWPGRFYFDPLVSLVITVIIFSSALPLVRSAAFILLQAVPTTVSIQDLREDLQKVKGVLSVHELHVWQLSETRIVASVHVCVDRKSEYMHIAQDMKMVLHEHGIHSSTIQPEFNDVTDTSPEGTIRNTPCMISCPPGQDCSIDNHCCPPPKPPLVDV